MLFFHLVACVSALVPTDLAFAAASTAGLYSWLKYRSLVQEIDSAHDELDRFRVLVDHRICEIETYVEDSIRDLQAEAKASAAEAKAATAEAKHLSRQCKHLLRLLEDQGAVTVTPMPLPDVRRVEVDELLKIG